jgi:hypothetical protein
MSTPDIVSLPGLHAPPSTPLRPAFDLGGWLHQNEREIAQRWVVELLARSGRSEEELRPVDLLHRRILDALVLCLGPASGPLRDAVAPILQQMAALNGTVAELRGLATSEVIEELQQLRELLLRSLLRDASPVMEQGVLGARDLLRLNRVVDQMVIHANVGHIDALFFSLLQGTGVSEPPSEARLAELHSQLDLLGEELERFRALPLSRAGSSGAAGSGEDGDRRVGGGG